jgi:hypothetical protein
VPADPAGRLHDPETEQRETPEQQVTGVAVGDPGIDRLADHRRDQGLAEHPRDGQEDRRGDGHPATPDQPPQVSGGGPAVRSAGIGEGKIPHQGADVTVPLRHFATRFPPAVDYRSTGVKSHTCGARATSFAGGLGRFSGECRHFEMTTMRLSVDE